MFSASSISPLASGCPKSRSLHATVRVPRKIIFGRSRFRNAQIRSRSKTPEVHLLLAVPAHPPNSSTGTTTTTSSPCLVTTCGPSPMCAAPAAETSVGFLQLPGHSSSPLKSSCLDYRSGCQGERTWIAQAGKDHASLVCSGWIRRRAAACSCALRRAKSVDLANSLTSASPTSVAAPLPCRPAPCVLCGARRSPCLRADRN